MLLFHSMCHLHHSKCLPQSRQFHSSDSNGRQRNSVVGDDEEDAEEIP